MIRYVIGSTVLVLLCPLTAQAKRVPSQYSSIGAAFAAAANGDTILVAAGTYREHLRWPAANDVRLRSEEGAAKTTIDGGAMRSVIWFDSRAGQRGTVEGFTIRNGKAPTGGGIRIDQGSHVIRHNRITGNLAEHVSSATGGGINVSGLGATVVAHNEIDNNVARSISQAYGGGIAAAGSTVIVGNHIHDNSLRTPRSGNGGGYGAGVLAAGSSLFANNLIEKNANLMEWSNLGGGVHVPTRATPRLLNNTIVGNTANPTNAYSFGGAVYLNTQAGITMIGNIVAGNSARTGGGIYCRARNTVKLDYNNVWKNAGGDYFGCAKGSNSISSDPKFVSATDRHLTSSSPCVDAIPAGHLPPGIASAMDFDMDPRRIDGDLDGGARDGARLDIGADEFSLVRLAVTGTPKLGNSITLRISSAGVSVYLLAADVRTGNVFFAPWGNLLLGPTQFVLLTGTAPASIPTKVPNQAQLVGLDVHLQSLVAPLPLRGLRGQLSNLLTLTPY